MGDLGNWICISSYLKFKGEDSSATIHSCTCRASEQLLLCSGQVIFFLLNYFIAYIVNIASTMPLPMSKYDTPSCTVHVSLVKRPWRNVCISESFLTRKYWLMWSGMLSLAIICRSLNGATSKQAWYADTVIYRLFEQAINTPTKHDLQGVMNPYHQQPCLSWFNLEMPMPVNPLTAMNPDKSDATSCTWYTYMYM